MKFSKNFKKVGASEASAEKYYCLCKRSATKRGNLQKIFDFFLHKEHNVLHKAHNYSKTHSLSKKSERIKNFNHEPKSEK